MENKKTQEIVKVKILTPYLTENLRQELTSERLREQMEKYGYDPNNLNGVSSLQAGEKQVLINAPFYSGGRTPNEGRDGADLIIAGSTTPGEQEVRNLIGSGAIVGRFSIFYGGLSNYSGRTPEEGGYALDIPKNVGIVRELLTDERSLDAILERKEEKIRSALDKLNEKLPNPILITPWLTEALKIN